MNKVNLCMETNGKNQVINLHNKNFIYVKHCVLIDSESTYQANILMMSQ